MELTKIFALRLRRLRNEKGIMQTELAQALGTDKQSVNNWEKGHNTPKLVMLCKIALYFDVSTDYLLGLTENPKRNE